MWDGAEVRLRRIAMQVVIYLPEDQVEALRALHYARELVRGGAMKGAASSTWMPNVPRMSPAALGVAGGMLAVALVTTAAAVAGVEGGAAGALADYFEANPSGMIAEAGLAPSALDLAITEPADAPQAP